MQNLNPTLWRTCRMLSGKTRLKLLRNLHDHPGQNIADLAAAVGISRSYASQEMRRIQSRGFLKATHRGASLIYLPGADPQVATAAPLLQAVQAALDSGPARRDGEMAVLAAGLAHERRMALARALLEAPRTSGELWAAQPMSACSFQLHLRTLIAGGFAVRTKRGLEFRTPPHPLGKALAELLRQGIAR